MNNNNNNNNNNNIGIIGIEVYFPKTFVCQEELEKFDGASQGKYTKGLGQTNMSFPSCNGEDTHSMALTVLHSLFSKYHIMPGAVGRLEVGTESQLDKSKSVKSVLMQLLNNAGNFDVEGVDCVNACYGGTAALFNSIAWMESPSSSYQDGKIAVVVMVDVAIYERGPARPTGGCGAVAIAIGKNPALILEPKMRASYMENVYDFYKPRNNVEYPIVDGTLSMVSYFKCIDYCYQSVCDKISTAASVPVNSSLLLTHKNNNDDSDSFLKNNFDYFIFHSPFNKLVQKGFARMAYLDYKSASLKKVEAKLGTGNTNTCSNSSSISSYENNLEKFIMQPNDSLYCNKEFESASMEYAQHLYNERVAPSTLLSKECGNCYTASLYMGLASLIYNKNLINDQRILLFSYGSGMTSTLFSVKVVDELKLNEMKAKLNLLPRLKSRCEVKPEDYTNILANRQLMFSTLSGTNNNNNNNNSNNILSKGKISSETLFVNTFYLSSIDEQYRRSYAQYSVDSKISSKIHHNAIDECLPS